MQYSESNSKTMLQNDNRMKWLLPTFVWNAVIFGKWQWTIVKLIMTSVEQSNPWREVADKMCLCPKWQKINHHLFGFGRKWNAIYGAPKCKQIKWLDVSMLNVRHSVFSRYFQSNHHFIVNNVILWVRSSY